MNSQQLLNCTRALECVAALLFSLCALVCGYGLQSGFFTIGALLCGLAAAGKTLYYILSYFKRIFPGLLRQFVFVTTAGLAVMLFAAVMNYQKLADLDIISLVISFPAVIFFALFAAGIITLLVLKIKKFSDTEKGAFVFGLTLAMDSAFLLAALLIVG